MSKNRKQVFKYLGPDNNEYKCYKCRNCGLLYTSPQPIITNEALNEIYDTEYYKNYFGKNIDYTELNSITNQIISNRLKREFDYFISFIPEKEGKFSVLDIGCGDGRFLEHFIKLDWDCFGIEPSSYAAAIARKRKITFLDINVLELDDKNKFDFIFMDNVIEHLDYPGKYIEKIYQLLKPSGVFVLKTPNSSSVVERTETVILTILPNKFIDWLMKSLKEKLGKGSGKVHRYGNLHPPVHLSIFNKKSITKALTNAGFQAKHISAFTGSEHYHLWKVERPKTKGIVSKILKIMKKTGDLIDRGDMLVAIAKKQ
jgi:SAM-dependent methyltransferase